MKSYNKKFQSTAGSAGFSRGHFLSKFSVFAEFIEHLPAATEFGVSFKKRGIMKIIIGIIVITLASLVQAKEISLGSTGILFDAPNGFSALSQDIIDLKWPQKRAPRWVVGNESASTTIAYDLKPNDISKAT